MFFRSSNHHEHRTSVAWQDRPLLICPSTSELKFHSSELPRKTTVSIIVFSRIVVRIVNILFVETVGKDHAYTFCLVGWPFTMSYGPSKCLLARGHKHRAPRGNDQRSWGCSTENDQELTLSITQAVPAPEWGDLSLISDLTTNL